MTDSRIQQLQGNGLDFLSFSGKIKTPIGGDHFQCNRRVNSIPSLRGQQELILNSIPVSLMTYVAIQTKGELVSRLRNFVSPGM